MVGASRPTGQVLAVEQAFEARLNLLGKQAVGWKKNSRAQNECASKFGDASHAATVANSRFNSKRKKTSLLPLLPQGREGWGEEAHSACCWCARQQLDAPLPARSSRGEGVGPVVYPAVLFL